MFEIIVDENLTKWYLENPMIKPDVCFCDKVRAVLSDQNNIINQNENIIETMRLLEISKKELELRINSEKAKTIFKKSQDFFKVNFSDDIKIKIFLLPSVRENRGGTFCKGEEPMILLRTVAGEKCSAAIIIHEFMHYMSHISEVFGKKRDMIRQKIQIPQSMDIGTRGVVEEGVMYVAEPFIMNRKINQVVIDVEQIERLGIRRAWGKFREQTLNKRKYSDLESILDSIPNDWEEFIKIISEK